MKHFTPPATEPSLADDLSAAFAHLLSRQPSPAAELWLAADPMRGRKSICAALRIDHSDRAALYATAPFRIAEVDGQNWIAAAVGAPRILNPLDWHAGEITDVILWSPRTSDVRIVGEAANVTTAIMPRAIPDRLTVFADGGAFFRAWADQRSVTLARIQAATAHSIIPVEPADGDLPGAFIRGDIRKVAWAHLGAQILVAGPGVDATKLNRAVLRSAQLPRVEGVAPILKAAA